MPGTPPATRTPKMPYTTMNTTAWTGAGDRRAHQPADEDRRAGHRRREQAVEEAGLDVGGGVAPGVEAAEEHRLRDRRRQQELQQRVDALEAREEVDRPAHRRACSPPR